jgi:drug/metabolite transporter (DMT)-like permease
MPERRSRIRPLMAVAGAALCFSTLAVLTKNAYLHGATPLPLLAWRFALVTVLLAAVQIARSPKALRVTRRDLARFAVLALTGYGAASVCYFYGLKVADASIIAVLLFTYPAMVAVMTRIFFGDPLTFTRIAAIVLTILGCALVVGAPAASRVAPLGVALGLGAGLGYAVFNVVSYRWVLEGSRIVLMTYAFGIAAVAIAVVAVVSGQNLSPASWDVQVWALLAAIVLVPTFAAVMLLFAGMRHLGPSQAAIVSSLEPLFTILLAAWLLGDRLAPGQLAGAALVLGGVVLAEWRPPAAGSPRGPVADEVAVL